MKTNTDFPLLSPGRGVKLLISEEIAFYKGEGNILMDLSLFFVFINDIPSVLRRQDEKKKQLNFAT